VRVSGGGHGRGQYPKTRRGLGTVSDAGARSRSSISSSISVSISSSISEFDLEFEFDVDRRATAGSGRTTGFRDCRHGIEFANFKAQLRSSEAVREAHVCRAHVIREENWQALERSRGSAGLPLRR
jgi:hypothetical protein